MRLGIFAKTFPGDTPLSVMRAAKDAGYSAVHYNLSCSGLPSMPESVDAATLNAIRAAAEETGVGVVGLSGTYNMAHPDARVRTDGARRLRAVIGAAKVVGAPIVTLCTGSRDPDDQWRAHPDNTGPAAWDDMLASLREALEAAEAEGVDLGVEPELANVVRDVDAAEQLLHELPHPRLKIVLDPANLFERADAPARDALIADAVVRLGPRIGMAHAKDRAPDGRFVAAGSGVVDFGAFVAALRTAGFDGPIVTHGCTADEAPEVAERLSRLEGVR